MRVSVLALLLALLAAVTALQLTPTANAPTPYAACTTAQPTMNFATVIDDAALDNTDIPSDDTLTPARGCKGCFG